MCMESFIEIYDGALTDNECDILIEEFELLNKYLLYILLLIFLFQ